MQSIKHILLAFDTETDNQPAIDRATQLCQATGARMTLLWVDYNGALQDAKKFKGEELQEAQNAFLNHQAKDMLATADRLNQQGIACDSKLVWAKRRYTAIVQASAETDCDLVIKTTSFSPSLKHLLFTPTDWSLLRTCPKPLLLTSHESGKLDGRIAAAIDPGHNHDNSPEVNDNIIDAARFFSHLLNKPVDLLHTFSTLTQEVMVATGETLFDYETYSQQTGEYHRKLMQEVEQRLSGFEFKTYVQEGEPEWVIPKFVEDHQSSLLVLGTSYRTGIKRALMGSTAEQVLSRISCDILAIKPPHFESPALESQ